MANSETTQSVPNVAVTTRDRFPDALRSLALGAVILGHWTMGAISVDPDGGLHVNNVLNINRGLWPATWLFVLIPLFFFVGGFSNATSYTRARRRGKTARGWVGVRLRSLLIPVIPFLLLVVGAIAVGLALGAPKGLTLTIGVVVLMPLWFIAVYSVLASLTPTLFAAHRRYGVWVVVALVAAACCIDGVRTITDVPLIGYANYIFVHGTMQQIGFFYFDGRLQRLPPAALAIWCTTALATLIAIVSTSVWAESMVGLSGERSNMNPPSIPSLLHGLFLIPIVMLAYPWLVRRLNRPRAAAVLDVAAKYSMPAFLWHLPVLVVIVGILFAVDVPFAPPGTGLWWALRPLYIALYAAGLWGLLAFLTWRKSTTRKVSP